MHFDLKRTSTYQAVSWGENSLFKYNRFFKILFSILGIIFFGLFVYGTLSENIFANTPEKILGGAILSFTLAILFWEINKFFNLKLKKPKLKYSISDALNRKEEFNLASFLDYEALAANEKALKFTKRKNIRGVPDEALLYFILDSKNEEIKFIFGRGELDFKELKKEVKEALLKMKENWAPDFKEIIFNAAKIAQSRNKERVGIGDILIEFAQKNELFKNFLMLNDLNKEDIENLANWFERWQTEMLNLKKFWERKNLLKRGSLGRDWASGFTINLDRYSKDWNNIIKRKGFRRIVGHKKEMNQIERILEKEELNNVLLVGEPGTGRKSIVEAMTQRVFLGKSTPSLNYKRVLELDLTSLLSEVSLGENPNAVLENCLKETITAGNIILVIDEFQNFIKESTTPGTFDISSVLARYLHLSNFQIIAITTYEGLHRSIEKKQSLLSLFGKVEVREITSAETLEFLENLVPHFEQKFKKFVSYKALKEILKLCSKYIQDIPFPKKAVEVLDEAMVHLASVKREYVLMPEHIKKVIAERTEIPLEDLEAKERETLLNLEDLVHQRIINQEEAVIEISSALRRARAEIHSRGGPIGSFLFLGPTGVGKTETAKALSHIYFRGEKNMIRLDMSEFQNISDIEKLIGSDKIKGLLTTPIKEKPFSLLLLDEIEKAHPNILNLFLQVLDEGWITDGWGRKINFRQTIIIATSNAGAQIIREDIKKNKKLSLVKEDLLDYVLKERIFRPEFINRFDAVVVFKPLDKKSLFLIARLMLKKLKDNLLDKGIVFEITSELCEKIVEISYNPAFGAREMRRVIQDKIENAFAEALLSRKLKRKDKVKIDPENFSLMIS